MSIWIDSVSYNRAQLPVRAIIRTGRRRVKVEWHDVCGDWCWFIVSGYPDENKVAILALIEQVERRSAEFTLY